MLGYVALSQAPISSQRDAQLSAAALAGTATLAARPQIPLVGAATLAGSATLLSQGTTTVLEALADPQVRRVYAVEISIWALTDRIAA